MKAAIISLFQQITNPEERKEVIAKLLQQQESEDARYYRIKARMDAKYPTKKNKKTLNK